MSKSDAADEIAWNAGAIGYCPTHFTSFKGTGDVNAAFNYWGKNVDDYEGVFSSQLDAKASLKTSIADSMRRTECIHCVQNTHVVQLD